jgi:hypothetical protein
MALADFIRELNELGYLPRDRGNGFIEFDYEVEIGPLTGRVVQLALQAPGDWPLTPPSGPRVSPRILPINPDAQLGHPLGGVHEAPELGPDWEYWSRPCNHWAETDRSAGTYMCHIRHLFDTLPHDLA